MDKIKKPARQPETPRKVYRTPVLTLYGDVRRLTSGGGGTKSDSGGAMSKSCWIAEVLYGVDSPRTLLVRAWLSRCYDRRVGWALVIVPLYRRFGEVVAAKVRVSPSLDRMFRPVFDRAVRQAYGEYADRALTRRSAA